MNTANITGPVRVSKTNRDDSMRFSVVGLSAFAPSKMPFPARDEICTAVFRVWWPDNGRPVHFVDSYTNAAGQRFNASDYQDSAS